MSLQGFRYLLCILNSYGDVVALKYGSIHVVLRLFLTELPVGL